MADLWYSIAKDPKLLDLDGLDYVYTKDKVGLPVQKWLTQSGDGLGAFQVTGNYATPTDFYYQAVYPYDIDSILIAITDTVTFNYNDYGGIAAGTVTNGVKFFYYSAKLNAEVALLSAVAVKSNYEWFQLTADAGLTAFAGTPQTLRVVFNLRSDYGIPFHLAVGDKFIIRVQDNFTGLIGHTFGLRGTAIQPLPY